MEILPAKGVAKRLGLPAVLATLHRLPDTLRCCGVRPLVGENGEANYVWRSQDVDTARQRILDEWDTESTKSRGGAKRGCRVWQAS